MVYMFLANGMEEIEALCPLDLMRRAGIEVTTVGVGGRSIVGSHGITVIADATENEFNGSDADMIFLPGGMPGTLNLMASDTVKNAINKAADDGKYIAAICAAPSILGEMGLLNGKEAVCYPGFEDKLLGARISQSKVVLDGNILTAKGMGAALEMGLKIVEIFCGKAVSDKLCSAVIAD